jgi:rhodanese-related sulfurtransferase
LSRGVAESEQGEAEVRVEIDRGSDKPLLLSSSPCEPYCVDHSPRFLALVTDTKARVAEIAIDEVRAKLDRGERFELVDVREDGEWAAGRIRGARHLGRGVLERDVEKAIPDTNAEIVLYCGGGFRSALAAESLGKMGYTRVSSMAGGWRDWVAGGGPTE